jgi:hypothetical protein
VSLSILWTQSKIIRAIFGIFIAGLAFWGSGTISIGTELTPLLYYDFTEPISTAINITITSLFFGLVSTVTQTPQQVESKYK